MKKLQASLMRNPIRHLIVAERARAAGIHISLWTYCRAGIPLTLLTLALGA